MATGYGANGIGHRKQCQAEGRRHTHKADSELRKCGRQHSRPASAEDQPRGTDELSEELAHHGAPVRAQ